MMVQQGELDFETAFVSMRQLGQHFRPVKAPWIIFRIDDGTVQHFHELSQQWVSTESIPTTWLMEKWIEV